MNILLSKLYPVPHIGFVLHIRTQRRPGATLAPAPLSIRRQQIGFVWRGRPPVQLALFVHRTPLFAAGRSKLGLFEQLAPVPALQTPFHPVPGGLECWNDGGSRRPNGRDWVCFARSTPVGHTRPCPSGPKLALFPRHYSPAVNWLCLYTDLPTDYCLPTTGYRHLALFRTNLHRGDTEGTETETSHLRRQAGNCLCDLGVSVVKSSWLAEEERARFTGPGRPAESLTPRIRARPPPRAAVHTYRRWSRPVCCAKTKNPAEISTAEPAPRAGGGRRR